MCRGRYRTERVGNLTLHATNSWSRVFYGLHAIAIALRLPRPQIVSVQDPHDSGLPGLIVARLFKSAFHVQVHADIFADSFKYLSLLNRLRILEAQMVLRAADGIRVVSLSIKRSIEARLVPKREIAVLPIFVDTARFRDAEPGVLLDRFAHFSDVLLWVGRFEPEKRPARALEALAEAAPPSACLIFLGSGSLEADLRAYARELGISDRVFFEGVHDPAPYYALADLVLITSAYEGYGRVIIEALASGTPVLSTDVGVADEHSGTLVAPGDFVVALRAWFASGRRSAQLEHYPYRNFEEYVAQYCRDIKRLV